VPPVPPALPLAEKDVEEDPVVVPGGVRELRPAGDVADGVGAFCGRAVAIVDPDGSLVVELDAALVAAEVVGVGTPADRDQQVGPADLSAALQVDRDVALLAFHARHRGALAQLDAFLAKRFLDLDGDVRILAREQVLSAIDDGDGRAEAPEHLRELAADVAAAQDHEVRGQLAKLHHRAVVQPGHGLETLDRRHHRPRAGVDDDGLRPMDFAFHFDAPLAGEPGMAAQEREAISGALEPVLDPAPPAADDSVLAIDDRRKVDPYLSGMDPEARGATRDVSGAGARHHRLGRRAADVDAGPTEILALDE